MSHDGADTLDINVAKMMSDSECGIRNMANHSIFTTFRGQGLKLQKQTITLDDILWSDGEDPRRRKRPSVLSGTWNDICTKDPPLVPKKLQICKQISEII